jgi:hypothetical protein
LPKSLSQRTVGVVSQCFHVVGEQGTVAQRANIEIRLKVFPKSEMFDTLIMLNSEYCVNFSLRRGEFAQELGPIGEPEP